MPTVDHKKTPKVLIAISLAAQAGRDKLSGICRYLQNGTRWETVLTRSQDELTPALIDNLAQRGFDGLILSAEIPTAALSKLANSHIPTVVMDDQVSPVLRRRTDKIAFAANNNLDIGQCAARHLLGQGLFQSFAFVGTTNGLNWSQLRHQAYAETLRPNGFSCQTFAVPATGLALASSARRNTFLKWMGSLKKPIGVFAAHDGLAHQIVEACLQAGFKIPEQVAVLGVNNDEVICLTTSPPLSSVEPDFEEEGFQSALLLDKVMRGTIKKSKTALIGVKRVVGRESTIRITPSVSLVKKAMTFIEANASGNISVDDIARHLKVSRRLLDLRFREIQNCTILDALQQRRLEAVLKLLKETDLPIGLVGGKCGYENENYLKNFFKSRFGMTMRKYRQHHRAP